MTTMKLPAITPEDNCNACGSCVGRRDFFRIGVGAAIAAAIAGALPGSLSAAPVRWTTSLSDSGPLRYPLPTADGVDVDRSNEVILVRYQGTLAAFALSCPHQHSMLRWRADDGIFQCSKHHSEYSPTGVYEKGRATRNMDRLAIHLDGNEVVVDPATVYHSDDDPQGWAAAALTV